MTKDSGFKALVRARMRETGENYTAARSRLIADQPKRDTAPTHETAEVAQFEAARGLQDRLSQPFFDGRTLRSIPARRKPRAAVLLELLSWFQPGRTYRESEVNVLLREAHEDAPFLRRELVNYRYLERDNHGNYWVCRMVPDRNGQEAQEVTHWERLWLPRFIGAPAQRGGRLTP